MGNPRDITNRAGPSASASFASLSQTGMGPFCGERTTTRFCLSLLLGS